MTADSAANDIKFCDDRMVRWFLLASAFWGAVSAALAVLLAVLLLVPTLFYPLEDWAPHFSFGRLYPVQVQLMIYGFLGNGFFSFVYFASQRLCRARLALFSSATFHFVLWQVLLVSSIGFAVATQTQGRMLAWMPWSLDFGLVAIWVLLFVPVVLVTLWQRPRGSRLPIPLWFVLLVMVAIPVLQLTGNIANRITGESVYLGIQDAIMQWWSARGMTSYWITVPAVSMLYYLVPGIASGKIYSYRIAVIHFWSIALLGAWGGNFQWKVTAIPQWMSSLAMIAGLLLSLGCVAGAYNLWRSLPRTNRSDRSTTMKLATAAVACYAIYSLDSAIMSFRGTTLTTQFTDWSSANQLLGTLGVGGLSLMAFSFAAIPRLFAIDPKANRGTAIRWLATEGMAFQVIALYVAGGTQAFSWFHLNDLGRLEYPEFVNAIGWVKPLWIVVLVGSVLWFIAMKCWGWTIQKAMFFSGSYREPLASDPVVVTPEIDMIPSNLVGAPVLDAAIRFEQWMQLTWHAAIERSTPRLLGRIFVAFIAGGLLVWLPSLLYHGQQKVSAITQTPYTALEMIGREIYVREGCVSCHTQASRPLVPEVLRYGDYSHATDYANDKPTQFGFRRVGPDLAREGGKQTSYWHWKHLENPRSTTPESVMPAFDHILGLSLPELDDESTTKQIETIAADIVAEGGPVLYGDGLLMNSRGIALIAYLQRLGVVAPPPVKL